ncbi:MULTISPECIES: FMN-binding protein [unclassified Ruminococcus]|uniref:FMN-binding protein n=1 Tax=unclassified Ruminococcus TaxID=2608920 RepID=UPI001FA783C3|nr:MULTISPECIES: FMN-binding protein [unclassified Ruminococcus]
MILLFLIALAAASAFSYFCSGAVKKHPTAFYFGSAVLSAAVTAASRQHIENEFVRNYLVGIFSKGAFAGALWVIVMSMGALPNGSRLIKRLMPIRGELSIIAATVTLSHIITYSVSYIKRLLNPDLSAEADFIVTCAVCLALVVIMIPLTVISFKTIRKKMNAKVWKNIQRAAYVFYALIYIHVMVIFIPRARNGQEGYFLSCIAYTAVWSAYLVFRLRKWYLKSRKPESKAVINGVCTACAAALIGGSAFFSYGRVRENSSAIKMSTTESAAVVFTAPVMTSAADADSTLPDSLADSTVTAAVSAATSEAVTPVLSSEGDSSSDTGSSDSDDADASEEETEDGDETVTTAPDGEEPVSSNEDEESDTSAAATTTPTTTTTTATTTTAPPVVTEPPAPEYIYNDGTYTDTAYGYDGLVHVTITIENDIITSLTAFSEEEEPDFFNMAYETIANAILKSQSTDVDAVSGATYSSNAIKKAVKKCLEQAKK